MGASCGKLVHNVRLDGKTAIVTGSNTGIGKVTVKELYKIGARVIMACRDTNKANITMEEIKKEAESCEKVGEIIIHHLDLTSLTSVRKCAQEILSTEEKLHLLINNAGIMMVPKGKTEDGFETQFGVNHLGHFLFTNLLLDRIINSAPARIINLSSSAHERGSMNWDDLNWERRRYSAFGAYAQSKLANYLFTVELAERLKGTGVTAYSVHPGYVKTDLGRYLDETYFSGTRFLAKMFFSAVYKTPEEGALTTLHCALNEEAGQETGLYYRYIYFTLIY
ncbi:hypothetical protein AAG570_010978 [Ranatra chinensis]|uniref:Retinol dehydrogenase 11 n=1 Tax=Ranatra chinensis TaxID=642074 RepID=A0ABD0YJJ2_9HEMI